MRTSSASSTSSEADEARHAVEENRAGQSGSAAAHARWRADPGRRRAYCAINEGLGKVMRFGGNDAEVLDRLRWIKEVLGPALGRALRETGGISLKPLIARGLTMGDEMHQRNVACSSLLLRQLAPALARTAKNTDELAECLGFIGRNDQFFLNVAMAMAKALTDPARNI